MKHPIHIKAVPREPFDLDRFVAALLALAVARVEQERDALTDIPSPGREDGDD